ncbi:MAG: hypothetical protein H6Q23_884 [Bacteroidetes bacterium]|nr:hypothetical protein [Bacteroidota bacterium]
MIDNKLNKMGPGIIKEFLIFSLNNKPQDLLFRLIMHLAALQCQISSSEGKPLSPVQPWKDRS